MRPSAILVGVLLVGCGADPAPNLATAEGGTEGSTSEEAAPADAADTDTDVVTDSAAGTDAGADGTPSEDAACRQACEALIPDPLACGGRAGIVDDCTTRCSAFADAAASGAIPTACADCVRASMAYSSRDSTECDLGPASAVVGVTGTCAVTVCNAVFPCYGSGTGTCPSVTHCVQPCGPMQGADGLCAFADSGQCTCQSGMPATYECASGTTCLCPACGEGEGLCVTPSQQKAVCFAYADQQLAAAVARFHCPP